jgi:hypothetical protein
MVQSGATVSSFADIAHTAADVTTVVAAVVLGAWAYVRSYGLQIARPAIELTVDARTIGNVASRSLIHVTLSVRNAGARECRVFLCWKLTSLDAHLSSLTDVKYRDRRTHADVTLAGQVKFMREVPKRRPASQTSDGEHQPLTTAPASLVARDAQLLATKFGEAPPNYEPVVPYKTFVSPGVTQRYDFVTSVPATSTAATIVGYIQYERSRSRTEAILGGPVRAVVGLSRGETKVTTFDHTTAGVVVLTPAGYAKVSRAHPPRTPPPPALRPTRPPSGPGPGDASPGNAR